MQGEMLLYEQEEARVWADDDDCGVKVSDDGGHWRGRSDAGQPRICLERNVSSGVHKILQIIPKFKDEKLK